MAYRYGFAASIAVGALLLAAVPAAAPAQCRLCPEPSTRSAPGDKDTPIQVDVETVLDFDRLVLTDTGEGAAALLPNGERSATGAVALVSARAMIGSVVIRGEPGRPVRIDMPRRIDLQSTKGGRIALDRIETDLPAMPRLDAAGALTFRFGGRLEISGDVEGDFRGDLPISVDYL